jgi:hypothetical protein
MVAAQIGHNDVEVGSSELKSAAQFIMQESWNHLCIVKLNVLC